MGETKIVLLKSTLLRTVVAAKCALSVIGR